MSEFISGLFEFSLFPWWEVMIRVALATMFGLILGFERELKKKPIDFRAFVIVCVSTCLVAVMSQELYNDYSARQEFLSLDLGKIIAGTLTGIGFLGAGAILKLNDDKVVGTATGASIWAAGVAGLLLGFGMYALTFISLIVIMLTLLIGGAFLEKFGEGENETEK